MESVGGVCEGDSGWSQWVESVGGVCEGDSGLTLLIVSCCIQDMARYGNRDNTISRTYIESLL